MRNRIYTFAALAALTPSVLLAAPRTFKELVEYLVMLMNSTISVLVVAALVIYFFGAVRQLTNSEHMDSAQMRKFLLMGLAIIFVMVSIWGILELLGNTFNSQSSFSSETTGGQSQQQENLFNAGL